MMFRYTWLACCLGMAILPSAAKAQVAILQSTSAADRAIPGKLPVVKLTLTPAVEPRPALQYSLLPRGEDRTPGNAAPFYYRALLLYTQVPKEVHKIHLDNHRRWSDLSLEDLTEQDKQQMRKWSGSFRSAMLQLRSATHREYCDWDMRFQDQRGVETIGFLLPEMQEARGLARVLDVKLRLAIAAGRYDEALEQLQMGYQLAHDVAKPPILISGLVGLAISQMMNARLVELIDSPDSPNLYWALAGLPQPLIDLRPAMRHEMLIPAKLFPILKDAEKSEITPTAWRDAFVDSVQQLADTIGVQQFGVQQTQPHQRWKSELAATALVLKGYPEAKRQLIARGYIREKVEAMPAAQVVSIEASHAYRYIYHEMFKWTLLPYWQADQRINQSYDKLFREGYLGARFSREILPFASLLMPAVQSAMAAQVRNERELAALRTIEAIRMHAAGNGGRLPKTFEEIEVVPVPLNPVTNKSFLYRMQGDAEQLASPSPPGQLDRRNGVQYQISISPNKK